MGSARVLLWGVRAPGTPLNVAYPEHEPKSLPPMAVASRHLPATPRARTPGTSHPYQPRSAHGRTPIRPSTDWQRKLTKPY